MVRILCVNRRYLIWVSLILSIFAIIILYLLTASHINKSFGVTNQVRKLPIYCVENDNNQIAITFDCAWGALS